MSTFCTYYGAKKRCDVNEIIEKKICKNIKNIRKKLGYTQDFVATKLQLLGCDITRSAFAKIEVGQRHIYLDEIIFIKQVLNVEYDEIFNIKD